MTSAEAPSSSAGKGQNLNCTNTAQNVGPWTFDFRQTTGAPDGSILFDSPTAFGGSVRATGIATRPGFVLAADCPWGHTDYTVPPIVNDGRFGPAMTFEPVPGDPTRATLNWYPSRRRPTLDFDGHAIACEPDIGAGTDFQATIPLSLLRKTTPITISPNIDWIVDKTFTGGTADCTGETSSTLTLQRVQANGSPLP